MRRSFQSLIIAAGLTALACAPQAQAATVTTCTESAVKAAIATGLAEFGVDCHLFSQAQSTSLPLPRTLSGKDSR